MDDYTVVDVDGHVFEQESMWLDYLEADLHPFAPREVVDNQGRARRVIGGQLQPLIPRLPGEQRPAGGHEPKARLEAMDSEGIDIAVLFPSTGLAFAGIEDARINTALCRAYNNWMADFTSPDPGRLLGVGLLPQADLRDTISEVRRCVSELGYRAVMMRPNPIAGRNLDDPAYTPLWSAIEDLGVPVVLHEGTTQNVVQSGRDRFDNFLFRHACSHPHEQQMACLSLICGGVLERHPGLRVVFAEAGCGWVPWWLERLDEHMEEWGFTSLPLPLEPSEYFARQCYVTTEPDEKCLPSVISLMDDDHIMFASDYPHSDAIFPGAVETLQKRHDLADSSKQKILGANAMRCLGLT
jgi:predicted TIM-barrel fold metal-dependent hydrolase